MDIPDLNRSEWGYPTLGTRQYAEERSGIPSNHGTRPVRFGDRRPRPL